VDAVALGVDVVEVGFQVVVDGDRAADAEFGARGFGQCGVGAARR
jgi:hypothetical protein